MPFLFLLRTSSFYTFRVRLLRNWRSDIRVITRYVWRIMTISGMFLCTLTSTTAQISQHLKEGSISSVPRPQKLQKLGWQHWGGLIASYLTDYKSKLKSLPLKFKLSGILHVESQHWYPLGSEVFRVQGPSLSQSTLECLNFQRHLK